MAGKSIRCPACKRVLRVPQPQDAEPPEERDALSYALDWEKTAPETPADPLATAQCHSCGKPIRPDAEICPHCGTSQIETESAQRSLPVPPIRKRQELREVPPLAIYSLGSMALVALAVPIGYLAKGAEGAMAAGIGLPFLLFAGPASLAMGKSMQKQVEQMGCLLALIYGPLAVVIPVVSAILGAIIFTPLMTLFDQVAKIFGRRARLPWDDFLGLESPRAAPGKPRAKR